MHAHGDAPATDGTVDPYAVGSYLTDGGTLLGVVGALPQEPSLRLVVDCRTLEITVVSVQDLRDAGLRAVASAS